jgi:hypothetical protein
MDPDLPVEYDSKASILFYLSRFEGTEKALVDAEAHRAVASDIVKETRAEYARLLARAAQ